MKTKVVIALLLAAAHAQAGDYQLKNRSVFTSATAAHNPFWPIGWVKAATVNNVANAPLALLKAEDFSVTSILLNDPPLAVVNGKEMAEGEILPMNIGNQPMLIQLAAVQDGQVVLRCRDQSVVILLRRKGELPAATVRTAAAQTALR